MAQHKCTALSNLLPSTVARRRMPLLARTCIRRTEFAVTILNTHKIIFTSENRPSRVIMFITLIRSIDAFQNISLKGFNLHRFTQQFSRV